MKNKKILFTIGVVVALVFIIIGWLTGITGKKEKQPEIGTPTPVQPSREISQDNAPTVNITIVSDRSGGTIVISDIAEEFQEIEYELIYTAESDNGLPIERGVAGGPMKIDSSRKITETVLFGTESCTTGVCKRHIDKNVSAGILVIRLIDNNDDPWSYQVAFSIEKTAKGYEAVIK